MPQLKIMSEHPVYLSRLSKCLTPRIGYLLVAGVVLVTTIFLSACSASNPDTISQKITQTTPGTVLKSPQVVVFNADKTLLDARGLNLNMQAKILNPNSNNVTLDDIKISILGPAGLNNIQDTKLGGLIEASSVKTFNFNVNIPKEMLAESELKIELNAKGINGDAAMPVTSTVAINIPDILNKLVIDPKITTHASITKISKNGYGPQLEAEVEGSVANPNPLNLYYNAIRISIKDSKGKMIASDNLTSTPIEANSDFPFKRTLILPLQALNETSLSTDVETSITVPNYSKSIKSSSTLKIPHLKDLISVPQLQFALDTTNTNPVWIETVLPPFLKVTVITTLKNDNELNLTTGDLKINLYKPKDTLLESSTTTSTLVQGIAGFSTKTLTNWFNLTADEVGLSKTDSRLTADIGIGLDGVVEKIPLSANIPLDIKPHGW
jgi:hypothetical protein